MWVPCDSKALKTQAKDTMNECVFLIQILMLVAFALVALKLGKEALTAWVCTQALIANLFVLKQITLFGLHVTASDAFAVGSLLGLNLLQEYHTPQDARKATTVCFFFMLFFALISQLHLLYEPSIYDESHAAFHTLLSPSPRLFIASLSVFFIVQQVDIRFFVYLKERWPRLSFATRTGIALVVSQFLDTFLFSFVGLYGMVASIGEIIFLSFLIKMIVVLSCTSVLKMVKA